MAKYNQGDTVNFHGGIHYIDAVYGTNSYQIIYASGLSVRLNNGNYEAESFLVSSSMKVPSNVVDIYEALKFTPVITPPPPAPEITQAMKDAEYNKLVLAQRTADEAAAIKAGLINNRYAPELLTQTTINKIINNTDNTGIISATPTGMPIIAENMIIKSIDAVGKVVLDIAPTAPIIVQSGNAVYPDIKPMPNIQPQPNTGLSGGGVVADMAIKDSNSLSLSLPALIIGGIIVLILLIVKKGR